MLHKIKNTAPLLLLLCTMQVNTSAQTPQQIMAGIYKAYDSIPYLTFDVTYTYNTDTLNGDFTHDLLAGSYTMAGKQAKYNLGNIDFGALSDFNLTI